MFISKDSNTLPRIGFGIMLTISALVLPWWITGGLAVIAILAFSWYLEAVAIAFFVDVVFSFGWVPWLTISIFLVLLAVEVVTYYISH